ncbi:hypothetical protein PRJH_3477 [Providencia rustigianii]
MVANMMSMTKAMFGTPNRGNQSSNINQLTPDWVNIAYQVNDSLLAGNQSDKFSSGYSVNILAQQSAKILADVLAKIYTNQSPKFTGNQSGEYFLGQSAKHFANLKRGEFTPLAKEVSYPHWQGLIGVTTRGKIEFLQSIKKGSQSATLGNVDIKYRASENINTSLLLWYGKYQLLGSMPRDFNSFLMMRFSQAAKDSSPSCACASSIIARNSGSNLNWKGGLPRRSLLCVDTLITPIVMYLCVITHYIHICKKATPRSATNTIEAFNHNVNWSNTMAMYKSTQTRPQFLWRFFSCQQFKYFIVIASSEQEARSMLPDSPCLFSARFAEGESV